jgi:Mg2+-importing ATPase
VLSAGASVPAAFANTLKYIFITTSANFGSMFSLAGLSLLIPFLPLLPKQILHINFLTNFPAMTIATDSVDKELVDKPRRWNVGFIRNFMITFGLISSVFDFLTFGALLIVLNASVGAFRTGWFVESVITELLTLLIIRTRRPFFRSNVGRYLLLATLVVALLTVSLPYIPLGGPLASSCAADIPLHARSHRGALRHGSGDREEDLL